MTPSLARRLLGLTATTTVGYGYGWWGRAYGITPLLVFTLIAVVAWTAGYVWSYRQHAEATSTAVHDRDLALARVAQLQDGQRYQPVPLEQVRLRKAMERHPSSKRGGA